jgi:hypothetical protein
VFIFGAQGCAKRVRRARRFRIVGELHELHELHKGDSGFSFVRSRENPCDVSAAFGLFIAPAQFAFRFHRSK